MKAVILFSGGLDSTVALFQARSDGADEILAVSFNYGSKHAGRELEAAAEIGEMYAERHIISNLPDIFVGSHSAVMGDVDMPLEEYKDYESGEGESITVVPFRNGNLISAAVTIAEVNGFSKVYVGMHATDYSTWAYPDCTPEFLGAMANAIYTGTLGRVRLVFPLIWMTKAEVVTRGALLGIPFNLTWSCYEGGRRHCGRCPTCLERIKAFVEAGYKDPVTYVTGFPEMEGLDVIN